MQTTVISGSSRADNNTIRLAYAIAKQVPNTTVVDFKDYDIPFPNAGGVKLGNLTPFQANLLDAIEQSHVVIVLTPEYNWFPSAELINMVNQMATGEIIHKFDNKVFAFVGVSSGGGGRMPTIQLSYMFDKIFNVFNIASITSPKKFEAKFIEKALDADGNSKGNHEFDKGLSDFLKYTQKIADRWH